MAREHGTAPGAPAGTLGVLLLRAAGAPARRVGDLPTAVRCAVLFSRGGVALCHVVGSADRAALIGADPRVRCAVVAGPPPPGRSCWLVADDRSVFTADVLERVVVIPPDRVGVVRDRAGAAVIVSVPAAVRIPSRGFEEALGRAAGDLDRLLALAEQDGATIMDMDAGPGIAVRVSDRAQAEAAERAITTRLANVRDGWVDRVVNRRLSLPITTWLASCGVHPNWISLASIVAGLGGAALVAWGGYGIRLLGLAVIQLASVLDCVDGELARLNLRESRAGHWLDVTGDTVAHAALFLGVGIAAWHDGLANALVWAGWLVAGNVGAFACVSWAEETAVARQARGGFINQVIDGLITALTTRDYLLIVILLAIAGRLSWFIQGAAIGVHVFWMVLLGLLVVERRGRSTARRSR